MDLPQPDTAGEKPLIGKPPKKPPRPKSTTVTPSVVQFFTTKTTSSSKVVESKEKSHNLIDFGDVSDSKLELEAIHTRDDSKNIPTEQDVTSGTALKEQETSRDTEEDIVFDYLKLCNSLITDGKNSDDSSFLDESSNHGDGGNQQATQPLGTRKPLAKEIHKAHLKPQPNSSAPLSKFQLTAVSSVNKCSISPEVRTI